MNEKTLEQLMQLTKKYSEIEKQLENPELIPRAKYTELTKEHSRLEPIIEQYWKYEKINKEIIEAKKALATEQDQELCEMLKTDIKANEIELEKAENELKLTLIPKDINDDKNVIIEIRGAVGGDEANIFAGDLYRMYSKYCEIQRWKIETIEAKEAINGGFSYIAFMIKGKHVFAKLKFEAGGHRVQRVPKTESQGRVHTSIATVAVLPEVNEVEIKINNSDLRIDTYRSSGAGGQHVNTTDSAIRITHIPTGVVVTSQDGRSQHDNKDKAMRVLRAKLYEKKVEEEQGRIGNLRKTAVGSGDRSEKIRTYNYPQNRVTDHRIGLSLLKLDRIMEGNIDEIIIALISSEQKEKLENIDENITVLK
ncbi:peptide chain release factor 1 [Spiroplasma endosymbiont of Colias croceus]|uniref:peptide chain release factor 1 n=1 Tax=Spiroplasma endosymbiont of Colias croceus TaxID=3066310 RepID=UPI0030CA8679